MWWARDERSLTCWLLVSVETLVWLKIPNNRIAFLKALLIFWPVPGSYLAAVSGWAAPPSGWSAGSLCPVPAAPAGLAAAPPPPAAGPALPAAAAPLQHTCMHTLDYFRADNCAVGKDKTSLFLEKLQHSQKKKNLINIRHLSFWQILQSDRQPTITFSSL